jgi:hypothetical protein
MMVPSRSICTSWACSLSSSAAYRSCRAGNEAEELKLTPARTDARAIAWFGTKDPLAAEKSRKAFQQIANKPRHALEKHSRPSTAANARFVPWPHVQVVIDQLEALKGEFDQTAQRFIADYAKLRADWRAKHHGIPAERYSLATALPAKI